MISIEKGFILLIFLLILLSLYIASPSFSCGKAMRAIEGRVVCLLPEKNNGKVKPVLALVTKEGEFYPLMDSEDLTHNLDINEKKIYESRY